MYIITVSILTLSPCFQLLLKAQASSMFKGKKENYPFSVCRPFLDTRIGKTGGFYCAHIQLFYWCNVFFFITYMIKHQNLIMNVEMHVIREQSHYSVVSVCESLSQ